MHKLSMISLIPALTPDNLSVFDAHHQIIRRAAKMPADGSFVVSHKR
jgi:hypothetical protein